VFGAFFDESMRPDAGRMMAVAGYILAKPQSKRLQKEWGAEIAEPYRRLTGEDFHMKRLQHMRLKHGAHKIDPFYDRVVSIINDRISCAVSIAFKRDEFEAVVTPEWLTRFGSLYGMCCYIGIHLTAQWADSVNYQGAIAYVFESGHQDQGVADVALKAIRTSPEHMRKARYGTHVFLDKATVYGLQAADVWAWNLTRYYADTMKAGLPLDSGDVMRDSLLQLLKRDPTRYRSASLFGQAKLRAYLDEFLALPWINKLGEKSYAKRLKIAKRGKA
jgi:hypothetical protein